MLLSKKASEAHKVKAFLEKAFELERLESCLRSCVVFYIRATYSGIEMNKKEKGKLISGFEISPFSEDQYCG